MAKKSPKNTIFTGKVKKKAQAGLKNLTGQGLDITPISNDLLSPIGPIRTYSTKERAKLEKERAEMEKFAKMSPKQKQQYKDAYSGLATPPSALKPIPSVGTDQSEQLPQPQLGQDQTLAASEIQTSVPQSVQEAQKLSQYGEQKVNNRWRNPFENVKGNDILNIIPYGLYATNYFLRKQDAIRDEENYQNSLRNQTTQKPIGDYNNLYAPDSSGGTQYQSLIRAKNGAEIRKGISPETTDVEVEGGELIQTPDGNIEHVEGPSHAKGGVHTNLPEGSRVFSDFLKPMGSKKTYAQLAKKYDTTPYKKVLENAFASDIDRKTAQLMNNRYESILNELFADQQLMNGNSDGTNQSLGMEEETMAKFGLDLKKGEKLSFTNPFQDGGVVDLMDPSQSALYPEQMQQDNSEYSPYIADVENAQQLYVENYEQGGEYLGGQAEFYGGGYYKDGGQFKMMGDNASTFYQGVTGDPSNLTIGTKILQDGGQITNESPVDTAKELIEKIKNNPQLGQAIFNSYKKDFKNESTSLDDLLNSFSEVTNNIYQIRSKASESELRDVDLDKGTRNAKYKELAKKYGVSPVTDENKIKKFQQVYRSLAKLQEDPLYKKELVDYELTPIGVDDTKWQGSLYSGKGISLADSWFGNTTIGQLLRRKQAPPSTPDKPKDIPPPTIPNTPTGSQFVPTNPIGETPSTMGRFPAYQALPNALGYLAGLSPANYFTPDFQPAYVVPPTLNIDDELRSIDDTFTTAVRQTTGNAAVDNSRNAALFSMSLDAKNKSFARKENFDASARFEADVKNANSAAEANNKNMIAAAQIYNDYQAVAKDMAETERLNSIFNLTDKVGKYYQDEYAKIVTFDSMFPNYYYNGLDPKHPINIDPKARMIWERQTNPTIPTTESTTPINKTV